MSSISPRPLRSSTKMRMTSTMSSVGQGGRTSQLAAADAPVELHAADGRQIVALLGVEQTAEQRLHRVLGRRLARAHHAVDRHLGLPLIGGLVDAQRVGDIRSAIEVIDIQRLQLADAGLHQFGQRVLGQLVVGVGEDLAGLRIDDAAGNYASLQELVGHTDAFDSGFRQFADMLGRDALVFGDDDFAVLVGDVEFRHIAAQPFRHQLEFDGFLGEAEGVEIEELGQDLLRRHPDRLAAGSSPASCGGDRHGSRGSPWGRTRSRARSRDTE